MPSSSSVDLVVVGAGAAGLAAAHAASERGLSFILLEAMDRIGGRAHTDHATFGIPWDRGCHWLHSASINPMRELADQYGFRYRSQRSPWRMWEGDRWSTDEEAAAYDQTLDRWYESFLAAGRTGQDVPISGFVDPADPAFPAFELSTHAEWGTSPDRVSTLDASRYRDTDENWPVQDGYGALVAHHGREIPVSRSTPVQRIDWGGPSVRVDTPAGTIEARAVLLTVSTNILAAGTIHFSPRLPDWKLEAAAAVPLGYANKVAFAIDGRHLGVEQHTYVGFPVHGRGLMSAQLRPFGLDLANGYLAGPLCRELELAGPDETIAVALDALAGVLGNDIKKHVAAAACSSWGTEPSILGAYGAALPGKAHLRAGLGKPIDNRLFFAGEATSPDFFSTCHGAHLSGIEAVREIAAALR